ncbi:MAG: nitroreductase, partial [Actinocatenispora sp.]
GMPGTVRNPHSVYAILTCDTDDSAAWLAAGEAVSAVLLHAAVRGIGTDPISDVIESPGARDVLRTLTGAGQPMLALRLCRLDDEAASESPRYGAVAPGSVPTAPAADGTAPIRIN